LADQGLNQKGDGTRDEDAQQGDFEKGDFCDGQWQSPGGALDKDEQGKHDAPNDRTQASRHKKGNPFWTI